MQRTPLLQLLQAYHTTHTEELPMVTNTIAFVQQYPECFERSLLVGHVTGSAWIVNPGRTHALLMHHKKLNKWFQPGGHCDGDPNVLQVAQKEAQEETGLAVRAVETGILDVDVHSIPARGEVPAHLHYDIRFLFEADLQGDELGSNAEAHAVRWIPLQDLPHYNDSRSILRLAEKTPSGTM